MTSQHLSLAFWRGGEDAAPGGLAFERARAREPVAFRHPGAAPDYVARLPGGVREAPGPARTCQYIGEERGAPSEWAF